MVRVKIWPGYISRVTKNRKRGEEKTLHLITFCPEDGGSMFVQKICIYL
jgi:hypothetical protein